MRGATLRVSRYLKKVDQFVVYRQMHNEIQQMKNLQRIRKLLTSKRQKFPPNSTPMEPTKLEAWERQFAVYVQATPRTLARDPGILCQPFESLLDKPF